MISGFFLPNGIGAFVFQSAIAKDEILKPEVDDKTLEQLGEITIQFKSIEKFGGKSTGTIA